MTSSANNLPLQLTSFIGREREITEVKRLLASTRLLTLMGSGGAGKTRLAIQVAASVGDSFPNGICFIDLAPLSDSTLVPQTVATVFGLQEHGGRPIVNALRDYLREKHLLLILDNCEHLIDACARFADDVLHTAPQVSILATSREALSIAGEMTFRAPSLLLPNIKNLPSLESLAQSDAVRLFVARASAVRSAFALTEQNARTVAQICHRLDGMPLALELAAVRIKTLSVNEIAVRLDDRFRLLTLGSRTAPTRQQTLRAAIDWSYDLLSEQERILLRRLSVFAGGWTLEAAEAVCSNQFTVNSERNSMTENWILNTNILDLLTRLADKSLIIAEEHNAQTRYRMLETIRQYAREKLIELGELNGVRDRHLNYFIEWAERAEPRLHSPEQLSCLNRLEIDNDNLRAALEWSVENRNKHIEGLRLVGALKWFWWFKGYWGEGCVWFDRVLASSNTNFPVPKAVMAKALAGAGWLAGWNHDLKRSIALSEESLALYRELGDSRGTGIALCSLAHTALNQEDYGRAVMLGEESAALLRQVGDQTNLCWTLNTLADATKRQGNFGKAIKFFQECLSLVRAIGANVSLALVLLVLGSAFEASGDYAKAEQLFDEALLRAREANSKFYMAIALSNLGEIALHQGQYQKAVTLCEESLIYDQELGYNDGLSWALDLLGIAACRMSEYAKAVALFKKALRMNAEWDYKQGIAENLAGLSAVLTGLGQLEPAARLCGAAEALLESVGVNLGPADREEYQRTVGTLLAKLDNVTFEKLWAEGCTLTKDPVIDYVSSLQFTRAELAQPTSSQRQKEQKAFGGLTPRERQVAMLVAQGQSNRDIADVLVLSERTVENHVGNILGKLDMHSRLQLAAWVVEKGLYKSNL